MDIYVTVNRSFQHCKKKFDIFSLYTCQISQRNFSFIIFHLESSSSRNCNIVSPIISPLGLSAGILIILKFSRFTKYQRLLVVIKDNKITLFTFNKHPTEKFQRVLPRFWHEFLVIIRAFQILTEVLQKYAEKICYYNS